MKSKIFAGVATVVAATVMVGTSGASAATEFGDNCPAVTGAPVPYTVTTLSGPAGSIPLTAPTGGIVTKVKLSAPEAFPFAVPMQVKLLSPAGGTSFTVTNQTTVQFSGGASIFDARMPVAAGEQLALHGSPFSYMGTDYPGLILLCASSGSAIGASLGDVPPGSTADFPEVTEGRVPVAAIIESDADNDGFGDETQDACPQSPTTQVACPVVTLSSSATAGKKSVTLLLTGTTPANVTVNGKVALGKGKKAKLKGGTKGVAPGAFTKFKLKFPAKLIKKLKELPPSKKLTLKVTSTAPNVAAAPTKKVIKVKLKGQGPTS